MSILHEASIRLQIARRRGNPKDIASALVTHGNLLLEAGQIALANSELEEAAALHHAQGHYYDEARLKQLIATLQRLQGDYVKASELAQTAIQLAGRGTQISVSSYTELGEIALAQGKAFEAFAAYDHALEDSKQAGLVPAGQAALVRQRALALIALGHHLEAAYDLIDAGKLFQEYGELNTALRTYVEAATALQQGGNSTLASQLIESTLCTAHSEGDEAVLADLYLLQSALAVERRDVTHALAATKNARQHALIATAPVSYISAAVTIAELEEANGNLTSAYESLAVGWVTLSDLWGRELAKQVFEPKLLALRERIGSIEFTRIKAIYEARRRSTGQDCS